jgi:hypothetical protein
VTRMMLRESCSRALANLYATRQGTSRQTALLLGDGVQLKSWSLSLTRNTSLSVLVSLLASSQAANSAQLSSLSFFAALHLSSQRAPAIRRFIVAMGNANSTSNAMAQNIITYIGVPLAVLGGRRTRPSVDGSCDSRRMLTCIKFSLSYTTLSQLSFRSHK